MSQSTIIPTRHRTNSAWAEHLARLMTRRSHTPHSMQLVWKQAGWSWLHPELVNKILNGILKAPIPTVRLALAHALDLPIWEIDPEPQPIHNRIAWHITDYRLRHNLTSEQFAERAGFGARWKTTYNIENGQASGEATQRKIFEFLQVRTVGGEVMDWEQYTSLLPVPAHPILIRSKRRPNLDERWLQIPPPPTGRGRPYTDPPSLPGFANPMPEDRIVTATTVVGDPPDTQPPTVPSPPESGPDIALPTTVAPVAAPQGPTTPAVSAPDVPAITTRVEGLDTLRAVAAELLRETANLLQREGPGTTVTDMVGEVGMVYATVQISSTLLSGALSLSEEYKDKGIQVIRDLSDLVDPTVSEISPQMQIRIYRYLAGISHSGVCFGGQENYRPMSWNELIRNGLADKGLT
jgi:transcriptional regulator with XRE-family HTH domain